MALFGEKYGDRVRMVTAGCTPTSDEPGAASFCSRELCGGTHVARTGEIGLFRILSEGSSAGGIRRIEALTGRGADEWATAQVSALKEVAGRLGVPASQVPDRVEALLAELRARNKELEETRGKASRASLEGLLGEVRQAGEIPYLAARVEASSADELSTMADWLRDPRFEQLARDGFLSKASPIKAWFAPRLLERSFRGFQSGKQWLAQEVWNLIVLDAWAREARPAL